MKKPLVKIYQTVRTVLFTLAGGILRLYFAIRRVPVILRPGTTDHKVFWSVFLRRELKLPRFIRPELIIDAGAYTGLSTRYFASKYPLSQVIAIEPATSNFEILLQQTARYPRVQAVHGAVWSETTEVELHDRSTGNWGFTVRTDVEGSMEKTPAYTIDTLLYQSGCPYIDILKLDVEGSEKEIFESATAQTWIEKTNVIMVELHDRFKPGCTEAVDSAIDTSEWNRYQSGEKVVFIRKRLLQ